MPLDPYTLYELKERTKIIQDAMLKCLTHQQCVVILLRFGFYGEEGCTLQEIANKMGKSRERIRQIEAVALRRLTVNVYQHKSEYDKKFKGASEARKRLRAYSDFIRESDLMLTSQSP